jgi:hypothetical protein
MSRARSSNLMVASLIWSASERQQFIQAEPASPVGSVPALGLMSDPTLEYLASEAEAAFLAALPGFSLTTREVDSGSGPRDGFKLVYGLDHKQCVVLYSDMQIEVFLNDRELFGWNVHAGFAGNAFSRENLGRALSRIAFSAAGQGLEV